MTFTLPFKLRFWTAEHWINLGIFVLGALTPIIGTATTKWSDVPPLFTPVATIGFLLSLLGFLRQSVTKAARDPALGTRSTDPAPTERIVRVGDQAVPVPPVTPGRPIDPDAPKP
jgi:hypothetical protein